MPLSDAFDNTAPTLAPALGTIAGTPTVNTIAFQVAYNIALTAGAVPNGTFNVAYDGQDCVLFGQTDPDENGVYTVNASGGAARKAHPGGEDIECSGVAISGYFVWSEADVIYGPFGFDDASPATKTPATNDSFDNTAPGTKTP